MARRTATSDNCKHTRYYKIELMPAGSASLHMQVLKALLALPLAQHGCRRLQHCPSCNAWQPCPSVSCWLLEGCWLYVLAVPAWHAVTLVGQNMCMQRGSPCAGDPQQ